MPRALLMSNVVLGHTASLMLRYLHELQETPINGDGNHPAREIQCTLHIVLRKGRRGIVLRYLVFSTLLVHMQDDATQRQVLVRCRGLERRRRALQPGHVVARVQQAFGVVEQERRRSVLRPGVRDLVI